MTESKAKKTPKSAETTKEFVERINRRGIKRNGTKKQFAWKR